MNVRHFIATAGQPRAALLLTGHSLGGALSGIGATDLALSSSAQMVWRPYATTARCKTVTKVPPMCWCWIGTSSGFTMICPNDT